MLYTRKVFTLPTNTVKMSQELWAYKMGVIDKEFIRLTGHEPDQEEQDEFLESR